MTNQYPHRIEMDAVLESLKDRTINPKPEECLNPFAVIINYISKYDGDPDDGFLDDNFNQLSDLEEAAVLKNFGLWYQKEYRNVNVYGRVRR